MKKYVNVRKRKNVLTPFIHFTGVFPGGSVVKNLPTNARNVGDVGSIPGLGRSPGRRNGNSLQYSCLGNPMNRGACQPTVYGVAKSPTRLGTRATPHDTHFTHYPTSTSGNTNQFSVSYELVCLFLIS